MIVSIWIMINIFIILSTSIYIWVIQPADSALVMLGQSFSHIAFILFVININMYFIFLVIRKSKQRHIKVSLATIARKMMKSHRLIGITGAVLVMFHVITMMTKLGPVFGFMNGKFLAGYGAVALLLITLFAGYFRHRKASKFRRKFHLYSAILFGCSVLIHIFY